MAAAMAAQRYKASYIVLERAPQMGGKASNAMVGTICGAYMRSSAPAPRWAIGGYARDLCEMLAEASGTTPERGVNGLWYLPYAMDAFTRVFSPACFFSEPGLRKDSIVSGCTLQDGAIATVEVRRKQEVYSIAPRAVVDCTGNGTITRLCGGAMIEEALYQAPTQVFFMEGVKAVDQRMLEFAIMRALARTYGPNGSFIPGVKHICSLQGSLNNGRVGVKVTLQQRVRPDEDFVALNAQGREFALRTAAFLRANVEAFDRATVQVIAPEIGVRTEPRPLGRVVLDEAHVLGAKKCADGIAVGAWPIEHWGDGTAADMQWIAEDDWYEIPADALTSAGIPGLYFGGRGISATEQAIASARVMGTCFSTGYGAGLLAVHHATGKTNEEAIALVRAEEWPEA